MDFVNFKKALGSLFGTFSKGVPGAVALNFSESASAWCSDGCKLKGAGCYAERLEQMRPNVKGAGVRRRRLGFVQQANAFTAALRCLRSCGVRCPWLRFSAFGAVPKPGQFRKFKGAETAFLALADELAEHRAGGAGVHFPVESKGKADFYQALVGDRFTVRESVQSSRAFVSRPGAVSYCVGGAGESRAAKLERGRELIQQREAATGRRSIFCPAITSDSKCGKCRACDSPAVDVVYLRH